MRYSEAVCGVARRRLVRSDTQAKAADLTEEFVSFRVIRGTFFGRLQNHPRNSRTSNTACSLWWCPATMASLS
jgi:hypothetical protein